MTLFHPLYKSGLTPPHKEERSLDSGAAEESCNARIGAQGIRAKRRFFSRAPGAPRYASWCAAAFRRHQSPVTSSRPSPAFTLPELLIAVSIFATVSTIVAGLYITSFRTNRTTTEQNRIYEDARFIMNRIADEIRFGMVDYDEYYNQYVVMPTATAPEGAVRSNQVLSQNYGQNYGRYYSAFFNSGADEALGFDCNNIPVQFVEGAPSGSPVYASGTAQSVTTTVGGQPMNRNQLRNRKDCVPLRRTIDRHTGQNPFVGKYPGAQATGENAFCGAVGYRRSASSTYYCQGLRATQPVSINQIRHPELYLISQDGRTKTILALEMIGGTPQLPVNALALLRMKGLDCSGQDGVPDRFDCADEFQCTNGSNPAPCAVAPANAGNSCVMPVRPLPLRSDLTNIGNSACDSTTNAFSQDFVPISPLTVNISRLNFIISPAENPHYAFSEESERSAPRVTIVLTVETNPSIAQVRDTFTPVTLIETISPRVLARIPAPVLVVP